MASNAAEKMSKLFFRGMDKMRHRGAFDVGAMTPTGQDFTAFDKARQIVLVTFKRSGEAIPSPINHGVTDGKLYVRTDASTGKVKRLRNNPRVLVVPSSLRGKPKGQAVSGIARILPESEHAHADEIIAANWSMPMKVFERGLDKGGEAFGIPMAFVETRLRRCRNQASAGTSAQGTRHASPELKPCSVMPSAVFIRARMFSTPIW